MSASNLICKLYGDSSYQMYRAHCGCTSDNHSQDIIISVENNEYDDLINVTIYSRLRFCDYDAENKSFIKRMFSRIKNASKLLLTGDIEVHGEFIFSSKEQVDDYVNVLKSGIKNAEERLSTLQQRTR
jgi:hypothetical protein